MTSKVYSSVLQSFKNRSILSMQDFAKEEILSLLDFTKQMKTAGPSLSLHGKLMANCFFEPSTRTRLSFETAMKKLGGDVIGFAEAQSTSVSKKESLSDTIKIVGQYADVIVLRHSLAGAARLAAESTDKPVINAGDGDNQHPTQTFLDLFSIQECQGRLDEISIAFIGDLKYSRTIHSLVQACCLFNMRMYFVAQPGFELPIYMTDELKSKSILFSFHPSLEDIIHKLDVIYMTRLQEERFALYEKKAMESFSLKMPHLQQAKPTLRILHPLPRVKEMEPMIDQTPYAYYFQQAQNGLYLRQALLSLILENVHK